MRKQRGIERDAMQQSNGDGKGHVGGGGVGTKVSNSNNLSILFARFPVLTLYFVRLILLPDRGSRPRANSVGETKRR